MLTSHVTTWYTLKSSWMAIESTTRLTGLAYPVHLRPTFPFPFLIKTLWKSLGERLGGCQRKVFANIAWRDSESLITPCGKKCLAAF